MKSSKVVRPPKDPTRASANAQPETTQSPKAQARHGRSGEGARSAMEQLILQEKARASDPARISRSQE